MIRLLEDYGRRRFLDQPPLVYHMGATPEMAERAVGVFEEYRATFPDERKVILDRYRQVDLAFKAVGIGSVGTRCMVLLILAGDGNPLILQLKEARRSVLEPFAGAGPYGHQGRRGVEGQRLTQTASDILLGSMTGPAGVEFYVRQLRDMKQSFEQAGVAPGAMGMYAEFCGWSLALAHAKSGGAAEMAGYLGGSDAFDRAIATFAVAYAERNRTDYEAFRSAVGDGRLAVADGL